VGVRHEEGTTAGPRDFLNRFRPAGTPGAAARAGVPVDRAAEAAAELGPVLALLAGTERECARLREDAQREAERTRQQARERAAALVAGARERAPGVRAAAASKARASADAEAAGVVAAAGRQAAALDELAAQRTGGLVAEVVAAVRAASAKEPARSAAEAAT
jgi:hypothetical protein